MRSWGPDEWVLVLLFGSLGASIVLISVGMAVCLVVHGGGCL